MLPAEKELVQTTWKAVIPIADTAVELFYGRLFELDPDTTPLFKGDMKKQGKKLTDMITFAVDGLDDLDAIVPDPSTGSAARGLRRCRVPLRHGGRRVTLGCTGTVFT